MNLFDENTAFLPSSHDEDQNHMLINNNKNVILSSSVGCRQDDLDKIRVKAKPTLQKPRARLLLRKMITKMERKSRKRIAKLDGNESMMIDDPEQEMECDEISEDFNYYSGTFSSVLGGNSIDSANKSNLFNAAADAAINSTMPSSIGIPSVYNGSSMISMSSSPTISSSPTSTFDFGNQESLSIKGTRDEEKDAVDARGWNIFDYDTDDNYD